MRQSFAVLLLSLVGNLALTPAASAQTVPSGFIVDTLVSTGLAAPHDFSFLPDGRIVIANRLGPITIYANGTTATVGTVANVEADSERGFLSLCPDPLFPTNGYLYVWYASTADAFMHLDRLTCTGDLANPASTNLSIVSGSRRVVLANVPDNNFNHNGGSLRFGPDGKLYLTMGEDATGCPSQTLNVLLGKLLRMDVSGLPAGGSTTAPTAAQLDPGDNPLSANTDFSKLVIGYGLRNPFRMTIDSLTNNIYIGDVGQSAQEEYDEYIYQPGALQLVNFGWPWREGTAAYSTCTGTQPATVGPIISVMASAGWHAVIGGPRYRNQNGPFDFGPSYEGNAFYGDYFQGELRMLVNNAGTWSPAPAVPGQPNATSWAIGVTAFSSIQVGPDGALYMTQHPATYATSGGSLKRIRPRGPVNTVVAVSGNGQVGPALEPFPQPLVARVNDANGNPLPGGSVNFTVSGPVTLSTTNPVIADSSGMVQTMATATNSGGAISVTATTPGGDPSGSTFSLFSRKISLVTTPSLVILQVSNTTTAVPNTVPMIILASAPGIPALQTPIGPICTDPNSPLTFVLEDSIGAFNFVTFSGTGAIGNPGLTKIYNVPSGALSGITLNFQAVGLDPVTGPFRTNCELKTF